MGGFHRNLLEILHDRLRFTAQFRLYVQIL